MAYCIVLTSPRYHHSTDALLGSSSRVLSEYGTFETLAYADSLSYRLAEQCDFDGDLQFSARPTSDPFTRPLPVMQVSMPGDEDEDDIPF